MNEFLKKNREKFKTLFSKSIKDISFLSQIAIVILPFIIIPIIISVFIHLNFYDSLIKIVNSNAFYYYYRRKIYMNQTDQLNQIERINSFHRTLKPIHNQIYFQIYFNELIQNQVLDASASSMTPLDTYSNQVSFQISAYLNQKNQDFSQSEMSNFNSLNGQGVNLIDLMKIYLIFLPNVVNDLQNFNLTLESSFITFFAKSNLNSFPILYLKYPNELYFPFNQSNLKFEPFDYITDPVNYNSALAKNSIGIDYLLSNNWFINIDKDFNTKPNPYPNFQSIKMESLDGLGKRNKSRMNLFQYQLNTTDNNLKIFINSGLKLKFRGNKNLLTILNNINDIENFASGLMNQRVKPSVYVNISDKWSSSLDNKQISQYFSYDSSQVNTDDIPIELEKYAENLFDPNIFPDYYFKYYIFPYSMDNLAFYPQNYAINPYFYQDLLIFYYTKFQNSYFTSYKLSFPDNINKTLNKFCNSLDLPYLINRTHEESCENDLVNLAEFVNDRNEIYQTNNTMINCACIPLLCFNLNISNDLDVIIQKNNIKQNQQIYFPLQCLASFNKLSLRYYNIRITSDSRLVNTFPNFVINFFNFIQEKNAMLDVFDKFKNDCSSSIYQFTWIYISFFLLSMIFLCIMILKKSSIIKEKINFLVEIFSEIQQKGMNSKEDIEIEESKNNLNEDGSLIQIEDKKKINENEINDNFDLNQKQLTLKKEFNEISNEIDEIDEIYNILDTNIDKFRISNEIEEQKLSSKFYNNKAKKASKIKLIYGKFLDDLHLDDNLKEKFENSLDNIIIKNNNILMEEIQILESSNSKMSRNFRLILNKNQLRFIEDTSPIKNKEMTHKHWRNSFISMIKNSNIDDYFYNSQNEALLNIDKLQSSINYYFDKIFITWMNLINNNSN